MSPILKKANFSKNATIIDNARRDSVSEEPDQESSFTSYTSRANQNAIRSPAVGQHKPLTNSKFSLAAKNVLQNRLASKKERKFTETAKNVLENRSKSKKEQKFVNTAKTLISQRS